MKTDCLNMGLIEKTDKGENGNPFKIQQIQEEAKQVREIPESRFLRRCSNAISTLVQDRFQNATNCAFVNTPMKMKGS